MIKEIRKVRDEAYALMRDYEKSNFTMHSAKALDIIIQKLDIILNEARTKERTRRLKIFENRKKVLDLIDETAKTNDNKMP